MLVNIAEFFCLSHTLPNYLTNLSDFLVMINKFCSNKKFHLVTITKEFSNYNQIQ